jgi:hypothetical protein
MAAPSLIPNWRRFASKAVRAPRGERGGRRCRAILSTRVAGLGGCPAQADGRRQRDGRIPSWSKIALRDWAEALPPVQAGGDFRPRAPPAWRRLRRRCGRDLRRLRPALRRPAHAQRLQRRVRIDATVESLVAASRGQYVDAPRKAVRVLGLHHLRRELLEPGGRAAPREVTVAGNGKRDAQVAVDRVLAGCAGAPEKVVARMASCGAPFRPRSAAATLPSTTISRAPARSCRS